jgi:hypothetical protein
MSVKSSLELMLLLGEGTRHNLVKKKKHHTIKPGSIHPLSKGEGTRHNLVKEKKIQTRSTKILKVLLFHQIMSCTFPLRQRMDNKVIII